MNSLEPSPSYARNLVKYLAVAFGVYSAAHAGQVGVFPNREIRFPTSGDGAPGDFFGGSMASCAGEILISAVADAVPIPETPVAVPSGGVYRYRVTSGGFQLIGKMILPQIQQSAVFGAAMVCDDNELYISAPGAFSLDGSDAGAVFRYVRENQGWRFNGEVPGSRTFSGAGFGSSMALNAGHLVIGARGEGAAYWFRRNQGSLSAAVRIVPNGVNPDAQFGYAVALQGDFLAVGAPAEDAQVTGGGEVFRYTLSGSSATETGRLSGPQGFGRSLAHSAEPAPANKLYVGSPRAQNFVGSVLMFGEQNQLLTTIVPPAAAGSFRFFGTTLAVDPMFPLQLNVGAIGERVNNVNFKGAVYRYVNNNKSFDLIQSFVPNSTTNTGDIFGSALMARDGRFWIGAPQADVGPHRGQGEVYVFDASGQRKLDTGRGLASYRFGITLAADQSRIVSGSFLIDSASGVDTGAIMISRRTRAGYVTEALLEPPDRIEEQRFAVSAAIDGDYLIVGSFWDVIGNLVDAGSVYIFKRTEMPSGARWQFAQKLVAPIPRERALFGFSVAIRGNRIAVGARGDQGVGSVTFFQRGADDRYGTGTTLMLADAQSTDSFSAAVALGDNYAVVTAPGAVRAPLPAQGRAYVYTVPAGSNTGWTLSQTIVDPAGGEDFLGFAISLDASRNQLLIGAPNSGKDDFIASGHALLMQRNGNGQFELQQRLSGLIQFAAQCGVSVSLSARGALLGCPGLDAPGVSAPGAVLWFADAANGNAGIPIQLNGPREPRMALGRTVVWNDDRVISGAPNYATENPLEGVVYELLGDQIFGDGFD